MARVYLAVHRTPVASKLVVLKQLRAEFAEEPDAAAMFMAEARVALRLSHRNVIHSYEASSSAGHQYLAMEFLEGKTLSQLLRAVGYQHIPLPVHLWALCEVLAGLQYAHGLTDFDGTPLGIVHCTVSPANVFVTRSGEVKLVDFGVAKLAGAMAESQAGTSKGKTVYASPEQCLGRSVDSRTDLYAAGVMLWEALARRRRSTSENALSVVQGRRPDSELDLARIKPKLPEALLSIVRKALALEPELRYQSAAAFQRDLRVYLQTLPGPAPSRLAAQLMELHFAPEFARVRSLIDGQLEPGSAPSLRVKAPPTSVRESGGLALAARGALPRASAHLQIRTAWPWLVGVLLLFVALVGRLTWRQPVVERSVVSPSASSTDALPLAGSDRASPATPPAPFTTVSVSELPLEAPVVTEGRRQRPAVAVESARRGLTRSAASAPHRALTPNSARNGREPNATSSAGAPQAELIEPGLALTPRASRPSTHPLDEKDPYLP